MPEPRYLDEVELTGARIVFRDVLHAAIVAAAGIAIVGYLLPANREIDPPGNAVDAARPFESHYAAGGGWTLLALAIVAVVWWRSRHRGYGQGYRLGFAAMGLPIVGLMPLASIVNRKLEHAYGYQVFWIGVAVTIALGGVALVCEPLFYMTERRRLERDVDPEFPSARVVASRRGPERQSMFPPTTEV
jgi:hypothetical protein